ncbi:unnamed protein product [Notodromas monacha]|uniref:Uncharacterized protein n=1 Tax=Notodromas monacha TaxID=399045 RepID=A0A7R9GBI6_9CRUS|nr:unnamed protein product [Notodromas monacha]CAG0915037.1 unnamed protein product [Notodromas monacha]
MAQVGPLMAQHNPVLGPVYKSLEERVETHFQTLAAAAAPPQHHHQQQAVTPAQQPQPNAPGSQSGGRTPYSHQMPPPPVGGYSLTTPAHPIDSSFMTLPTPAPHRQDRY